MAKDHEDYENATELYNGQTVRIEGTLCEVEIGDGSCEAPIKFKILEFA